MTLISRFANSILFWAAWIVIPVIMEFIPSIGSIFVLFRKRLFHKKKYKIPVAWPEITLIIPVYNSADSLEACIASIENSSYPDEKIRVFLINNKGKDDSFDVYKMCQEKYPNIMMQWLNSEQGKSRALNMGLFNSDGKYIIHVDSDGRLEKDALKNMVVKFENELETDCMTGAILTMPEMVEEYPAGLPRLFRKMEFMEYAQAFLAGRNYSDENNSIYTLSGAFSAFRKSAVLKSQLYNTDTICEDTNITFQMRFIQDVKIHLCEDAIFMVDPIEDFNKLYTQRQRWQRGSLEVSHQFLKNKLRASKMLSDVTVRTLIYDHTFAFPRLIWYLALICLMAVHYSTKMIALSSMAIIVMYIVSGYLYYLSTVGYLKEHKEIRAYYAKQWYVVALLPFFNFVVFFIRFAGVINSINTDSAWKTKNLTQEQDSFRQAFAEEFKKEKRVFDRLRELVNNPEEN